MFNILIVTWCLLVHSVAMSLLSAPPDATDLGLSAPYLHATYDAYNEDEYTRDITLMLESYRYERGKRVEVTTLPLSIHETKFRAWKRNSDIINSLLSLPKQLANAGRK